MARRNWRTHYARSGRVPQRDKMKIPDISYRTPVMRYDPLAQVEVYERRNTATGEVTFQTPSAQEVKDLQTAVPVAPARDTAAPATETASGTTGKSDAGGSTRVSLIV